MTHCKNIWPRLAEYVSDGEPRSTEYADLRAHLATCFGCRMDVLRLRLVEDALRSYPLSRPSPLLIARILERVHAQQQSTTEEWRLLPWDVWLPSLALMVALAIMLLSLPTPMSADGALQGLQGMMSQWPEALKVWIATSEMHTERALFWAIWSGLFATSAGIGLSLALANWREPHSKRMEQLNAQVADVASRLRALAQHSR
jgi:hypothetical protein